MQSIKIDVDGVIRDIFSPMCDLYNKHYNDNLSVEDIFDYDVDKVFPKIAQFDNIKASTFFFEEYAKEIFLYSKPYEGVKECLKALKDYGYKIIIATWQFNNENKHHTLEFLDKNDLVYDDICFTKDKWQIQSNWMIDDNPEFLLNKKENSSKIMVNMPYNKKIPYNGIRINGLYELLDLF